MLTVKEIEGKLYNYNNLEYDIKDLELKLLEEKEKYIGYKSIVYTNEGSCGGTISSGVEKEIILKEKNIEELQSKLNKKIRDKIRIENALNILGDTELNFVKMKYLNKEKLNMSYIAYKIKTSERSCYRLRNNVIEKISNRLN